VAMVAAASAAVLLALIPDLEAATDRPKAIRSGFTSHDMLLAHRRLFGTLGLGVLAVGMVRAARQTVLPLWAQHLGLSPEQTSLIFGIASAVDMALFYPSGKVMDHFGRLAVALPAMFVLGVAMMVLPLTTGAVSLTIVAMVMSFGNGIGSGMMMTIGADVAPPDGRIRFLSIWRVESDSGNALGPVAVSVVATAWTLAAGIVAVGSVGLLACVALRVWMPRYSAYATPRAMRAARLRVQPAPDTASLPRG
jgi:MFS family permease